MLTWGPGRSPGWRALRSLKPSTELLQVRAAFLRVLVACLEIFLSVPGFWKGNGAFPAPHSLLPEKHVMEKPAWAEDRVRASELSGLRVDLCCGWWP